MFGFTPFAAAPFADLGSGDVNVQVTGVEATGQLGDVLVVLPLTYFRQVFLLRQNSVMFRSSSLSLLKSRAFPLRALLVTSRSLLMLRLALPALKVLAYLVMKLLLLRLLSRLRELVLLPS